MFPEICTVFREDMRNLMILTVLDIQIVKHFINSCIYQYFLENTKKNVSQW